MTRRLAILVGVILLIAGVLLPTSAVYASDGDDNDSNSPQFGGEWTGEDDPQAGEDSVVGLYNRLVNTSGWEDDSGESFTRGENSTYETDYKESNLGGWDEAYIDDVDLAMFQGHSAPVDNVRALQFSTYQDDYYLEWDEARWGDHDMEWIFLCTCNMLSDASMSYWSSALNGTHLICGSKNEFVVSDHGLHIGDLLVDDGWWDSPRKVKTAWFNGCDYDSDFGRVLRVIGETSGCGDDYIWRQGSVCSDPVVDGNYSVWTYNCA